MFDIVTFGSATRDLFIKSKEFKTLKSKEFITGQGLCFNLGSKIRIDDLFFATGGGGTNTAATFNKQGFKTAYVGRVGNDPGGKVILEELDDLRVTKFVSIDKKTKTAYSIVLSSGKERTILVYQGACHYLERKDIPFNRLKAKWFYIAGFSGQSAKVLNPLVDFAKKNKIKIALNPSSSQLALGLKGLKSILSKIDVLLLNQEEGARLAEMPYQKERKIFKKLDKFVPGIIVMTKGPKGAVVSDGKYIYVAGTFKEKRYVDRTGAGDAFGSGFVSGLIRGGIEQGIRLGSANGTAVVEDWGAKNGLLTKNRYLTEARWKKFKIVKYRL